MEIVKESIESLQSTINNRSHYYLKLMKEQYAQYFTKYEQKDLLEKMELTNFVNIENEFQFSFNEKRDKILNDASLSDEEKKEQIDAIEKEVYHKPNGLDDDSINIYVSKFKNIDSDTPENVIKKCDDVMVHETFNCFIRPEEGKTARSLQVTEFISRGLVDYCSREFMSNNNINAAYSSEYAKNVMFIKEALKNVPSEAERKRLIFNASIDEFIEKTTTPDFDCLAQAESNMQFQTDYDRMVESVGDALGTQKGTVEYDIDDPELQRNLSELEKNLYEIGANSDSMNDAINRINDAASQFLSEEDALAVKTITEKYLKDKSISETNEVSMESEKPKYMVHFEGEEEKRKQAKSETINPPEEIQELYKEISKIYMKNKNKTLVLAQEHKFDNAGYTSTLVLYLLVSFISGAAFTILFMLLR